MKYAVNLNGKKYEVEVERIEEDFRAMTLAEIRGEAEKAVETPAVPASKPVENAPVRSEQPVSPAAGSLVRCPMPGKVLEVKAAAGQKMQAGDVILTIEAMKMENEIVAPQNGVVESIRVKQGDAVETDQILAVLN